MSSARRAAIIVLDGLGCGPAPDTAAYGDAGSDTLGNVARAVGGLALPNLQQLGLGLCEPITGVAPVPALVSAICRPDAVVMVFPGLWAVAGIDVPVATAPAITVAMAMAINLSRLKIRIRYSLGDHWPCTRSTRRVQPVPCRRICK